METLAGAFAECVMRRGIERERGLEVGAGCRVFDADDAFGEAEAFRLSWFRVEEAFEAAADIGGSRQIRLGFRVGSEESEDTGFFREREERGRWVGWVER